MKYRNLAILTSLSVSIPGRCLPEHGEGMGEQYDRGNTSNGEAARGQLVRKVSQHSYLEGASCNRFSTALLNPVATWANPLFGGDRPRNHADVRVPELSIARALLPCIARRHSAWQRSAPRS